MKIFIKLVVIFLIPLVVILVSIEVLVQNIPNSYDLKTKHLNTNSSKIETLILGNSHSLYGIDPKYFKSKTFNAANVSQSLNIDLATLKAYENGLKSLNTIIIRLSYDTLNEELNSTSEAWRLKDYKCYTKLKLDYKWSHNSEVMTLPFRQHLKSIYKYYFKSIDLNYCSTLGWGTDLKTKSTTPLAITGSATAKKHTAKAPNLVLKNKKIIHEILEWCKQKDIKVLLITLPTHATYYKNLNTQQLLEMEDFGKNLQKKYSTCKYLNMLKDARFTENDFYDADHLNKNGAKKLSLILNTFLQLKL